MNKNHTLCADKRVRPSWSWRWRWRTLEMGGGLRMDTGDVQTMAKNGKQLNRTWQLHGSPTRSS